MSREAELVREMTYTPWELCCGDPVVDDLGTLRQCRRHRGHKKRGDPEHASDYPLYRWGGVE